MVRKLYVFGHSCLRFGPLFNHIADQRVSFENHCAIATFHVASRAPGGHKPITFFHLTFSTFMHILDFLFGREQVVCVIEKQVESQKFI
jgi:hypothetical protein